MRYCAYTLVLTLLMGCAADRAVVQPWDYAPASPIRYWKDTPTKHLAKEYAREMEKEKNPELPQQKEPLTLGEIVDVALRNNTQTRQTWAQAREAAAQYGQSQQNFFPQATATYNVNRIRELFSFGSATATTGGVGTASAVVGYYTQWGPQLALSYLIFDFGTTRATSQAALWALYNANLTHNREIETVVQNVTTDYYNYLYQKKLLSSYVDDIADAKMTLDAATTSLKAGVKSVSDYLQAKSQLLQLETEWVNQKQSVKVAYATLLTDMGLPANMDIPFEDMPNDPQTYVIMSTVNELISLALEARSDLVAAESNVKSKQKSVRAAITNMLPTVSTTFDVGRNNFSVAGADITDHYDFTWTVGISWSLFSGFYNLNAIKLAQANEDYAKASLRQTELGVIEQITTSHYNVAIARDALNFTTDYLKTASEEYEVAIAQYKAGTTTILTVTNAQTSLADARAKRANALQQWFVSLSTLGYAIGVMEQDLTPYIRGTL